MIQDQSDPARTTHILHRQIAGSDQLPIAVAGRGIEIIDKAGKSYIDASSGAAVSCLGHGHPRVNAAIKAQTDRLAYAHTSFFTTDVAEELADHLVAHAPAGLDHVYYVSGGSEAMEAALKMARQYFIECGEPGRVNFIGRRQSYHGNTLGVLAVGGNLWRRQQFAPMLFESHHVSPPYAYRDQRADETPEAYGERLAAEFEAKVEELGPETVIAFVAETVGGATQGCTTAPPGYFKRIRQICDRYGILLVLDEVMCGMGRTGTLHACEQEGITPDLLAIAKGLGGGYQPIGAVLLSGKIFAAFRDGSGFFQHGHTYLAHPLACAASLAVQKTIEEEDLLANVRKQAAHLERRLKERFGNHHHVGDIRGRGLFWAVEYVTDRATKTPFDPALKLNARVKREALARGLACYAMPGTIDGKSGDHNMLAPPFICTTQDIDTIVERLGDAVDAAIQSIV
ncbi:aspartate aminotransferase family protein [Microvirga sp. TS319]|uniref:aspartate aminotransferase family protein n=1 Tax=Microvirga sp. TS319 TaxID=3241165 RepID=UPI00351A2C7C